MEELELYIALLIVLILLVILIQVWTKPVVVNVRTHPYHYQPSALNDLILVSNKGQPCAITREQFAGELQKVRDKMMDVIGKASSDACRKAVADNLPSIKAHLNKFAQNKEDIEMCSAIHTVILGQSPDYLAKRNHMRSTLQQAMKSSQSDTVASDAFAKDVDELLSLIEAAIIVVAKKLCTPMGRLDLDYLNNVLDIMATKVCEYSSVQSAIVDYSINATAQPWFDAQSTKDTEMIQYAMKPTPIRVNPMKMAVSEKFIDQGAALHEVGNTRRKRNIRDVKYVPSSVNYTTVHMV